MGRKKVLLKRIEDKRRRQVTFTKRRSGLMKKASDLSVLCDCEVALIVHSCSGKHYEFCSGNRLADILKHYQSNIHEDMEASNHYQGHLEEDLKASKCLNDIESHHPEYEGQLSHVEILELVQNLSQLEGPNVEKLSVNDLAQLERRLNAALTYIRSRKTQLMVEFIMSLQEKESKLREENKRLELEIAAMQNNEAKTKVLLRFSKQENSHSPHPLRQATLYLLPK